MSQDPVSVRAEESAVCRAAAPDDVDAIHQLITEAARTTTVLPRPRETIESNLGCFIVAERSGRIVGCGALTQFTAHLAEIRSLVVAEAERGRGIGGLIISGLVGESRRRGCLRVFALTDNPGYFISNGFSPTSKATLPHKVWNECVHCPKFTTCTEEAVDMFLAPGAAAVPGVITLEE